MFFGVAKYVKGARGRVHRATGYLVCCPVCPRPPPPPPPPPQALSSQPLTLTHIRAPRCPGLPTGKDISALTMKQIGGVITSSDKTEFRFEAGAEF